MILPESRTKLADWSMEIIERCRVSAATRAQLARALRTWRYTGSPDGNTAIVNRMNYHISRKAGYLFSPRDLRFCMEFTNQYPKTILDQAEVAARVLTREYRRRDVDIQFGRGVDVALEQGASIVKVLNSHGGISADMVMPWQMGVYREDKNGFDKQEAVVETNFITPFDLWRRISHLREAPLLFKRALSYAKKKASAGDDGDTYFHQVLLAGTQPEVQTDPPYTTQPGGLVQVSPDPSGAMLAENVLGEMIMFHELWVLDDETEDFTTIQIAEPDILIAPQFRRRNMFVPGYLPYSLVQPNEMPNYFWGRSEMSDLMKLQQLLRDRMEDIKKLMSLQYDRFLAISSNSGMTDELYDQSRQAGYMNLDAGSQVEDLTPPLPKEAFADIHEIKQFMDEVSGFANVMSGEGEPGVRAGNHAQMLLKTASPSMRDQALLVERQCADVADKVFRCLAAKDASAYWVGDAAKDGNEFLLSQMPDDMEIGVDSHSTSPIYEDDHKEMAAFLGKLGVIGGEDLIDLLPLPHRDLLKQHMKEREAAKAAFIQQHPEALTKGKKH